MAAATSKAKAAAALKEGGGAPRHVTWRGLELTLPEELYADVAWDIAEIQAVKDTSDPGPLLRLITGILGAEQTQAFRGKMRDDKIPLSDFPEALMEMLTLVLGEYGMAEGESGASPAS